LTETTTFTDPTVTPEAVLASLADAGFHLGRPERARRTLLDTFDLRLRRARMRLERRLGAVDELVLTAPGSPPARLGNPCAPERPRRGEDLPAGPFRARLASVLEVRALLPLVTVRGTSRIGVKRDANGQAVVTVVMHQRLTLEGGARARTGAPRWVVEVEPLPGFERAAQRAEALMASLGLRRRPGDVVDLMAAVTGADRPAFDSSPTIALDRHRPAYEAFALVLRHLATSVEANRPGTIDDVDPEFLHDLRVAVRRTRSVLGEARRVLPPDVRSHHRQEFRWLGTATSPVRDLDVYLIEWGSYTAALDDGARAALEPARAHLAARRQTERAALTRDLRSARYERLVEGWLGWLAAPVPGDGPDASTPIGRVASRRIDAAQEAVLGRGRSIGPGSPAEDLHELRKDAKKLRYLLECFGGLYDPAARQDFVKQLKALQDNLGEHQDAEVHVAQLKELAGDVHGLPITTPGTMLAMGQLTQQLDLVRTGARAEFASRFAAYDTARVRRSLHALLEATP